MADIVITPNLVVLSGTGVTEQGTAGATLTAGQAVYKQASSNKWLLADNDSVTPEVREAIGVALHGASLNQPIMVLKRGDLNLGSVILERGAAYYLSDTPGGIGQFADLSPGEYICLIGMAESTSVIHVDPQFPDIVYP